MITVKVEYSRAKRIGDTPTLTSGMVGVPIRFEFSAEWEGLEKTAVFSNGEEDIAVWLTGDETVIPWEVLANAGDNVLVGIYGADASHAIVIPTVTALLGVVHQGTTGEGAEGMDPTLPVWAQLEAAVAAEADARARADAELNAAKHGHSNKELLDSITLLQFMKWNAKQDKLTAGENVTIVGNVISAAGGGVSSAWADITGKPGTFPPSAHEHTVSEISDFPAIPTVPTAEIAANTTARHTHGNKTVLDGITAEKVAAWDACVEDYTAALGVI